MGSAPIPNLVRSTINPEENSLTFYNSAASHITLEVLLDHRCYRHSLVLAYGTMIYRIFRGKVKINPSSY